MLEVDCPCVTPQVVLKASGHVEKFTDLMVKDEKTGTCYRADHLLKDYCNEKLQKDLTLSSDKAAELKHVLAMLDDFSSQELGALHGLFALHAWTRLFMDSIEFNSIKQTIGNYFFSALRTRQILREWY